MPDILVYLLVFILVCGIIAGGIWISKKFGIRREDYNFVLLLLGMVNYITTQIEWKYKEPIVNVMELVIDAIEIVSETEEIEDPILLKQYALDEARKLCEDRGIEVDAEFEHMLSVSLDYLLSGRQ